MRRKLVLPAISETASRKSVAGSAAELPRLGRLHPDLLKSHHQCPLRVRQQSAREIHAQLAQHYFKDSGESVNVVSQGFTPLKFSAITAEGDVLPLYQVPPDKNRIATLVYGGFSKCAG